MPIKVLVIDDSALIRQILTDLLNSDPDIEVVGTAADPHAARDKIKTLQPTVLTLDIEMPRMDGLTFLERLMALRPTPVIVVSSLTQKGTDAALRALELGAVDYVAKPMLGIRDGMKELSAELIAKVKAAAEARVRSHPAGAAAGPLAAPARAAAPDFDHRLSSNGRIVAIGASTGGVEALQAVLMALPANAPAILITQHMPAGFTASFARRLNERCAMTVAESTDGAPVTPGRAYIANGNRHLKLVRSGGHYVCRLSDEAPVSGHRPSVDVLFHSVAKSAGRNALGIIMTGMGRDGVDGLMAMRQAGARTIGQDEASCLIYGMPKVAKLQGAVEQEVPLLAIPQEILA